MPRRYDKWVLEENAKYVSTWKTYTFFEGDVISFNFGFGCHAEGEITYINPTNTKFILTDSKGETFCHGMEEPWISQVKFLKLSPKRNVDMKTSWLERFALSLLQRSGFFDRHGSNTVIEGIRKSFYKVGR